MKTLLRPRSLAGVLLFLTSFAATLRAQAPAKPATPTAPTDEVVALSPFEVKDTNENPWAASSTLLGNRTNQDLVKLPVTVDVLTRDFMSDIGVFNMEDAAAFVSGLTVTPRLEARTDDGRVTFRGLAGGGGTSRNFFQWSVPSDTYNVERFDFGKGSNSLMFGDSTPGGQVTTTTKRARFANANEMLLFYDSLNSYRAQIDLNRKIGKNFAVRFNAVNRRDNVYVDHSYQSLRALDLALTYRPFANTIITLEGERGIYARRRADNTAAIQEAAAAGRSFANNNRWYVTSDGEVVQRTATSPDAIDRSGGSGASVSLLEGQSVAVRMPDGSSKVFKGFSRSFNILGIGDYLDRPFNVVTTVIEQRIGKLALQVSYNQQFQHQNRNDNSFGGSASPPVINVDGRGRPFLDLFGNLTQWKNYGNLFKAGRVSAQYPFEFGKWMKQDLVVTGTRSRNYSWGRLWGWVNTAAPGLAANNVIQLRAYLDDPAFLDGGGWAKFLFPNLPRSATFTPELVETYQINTPSYELRYQSNYTASLSGEYFGGRLTTLFGVSYNRISRKIPVDSVYVTDAAGRIAPLGTPDQAPQLYRYDPNFSLSARSTIVGANYGLIKKENFNLNLYGAHSQSFNFQGSQIFTGRALGPIMGTTREAGIKGDVLKGRLFYTVGVYEITRQNAPFTWNPDSLSLVQMEDLFNPNNLLASDPKYFTVFNGLNNERRRVSAQEKSRGVDVTLIGQRVHGLQTRLTFSKTEVKATRDFAEFQAMLDAAIARTAAANAPGGNPALAENPTFITAAQGIVASNTAISVVTGRRSAPYTASAVFDYQRSRESPLRFGLSASWTPNFNLAILNGVLYRGGAACPIGAYAMYDRKIFNHRVNFRFGANRIYDLVEGDSKYYKTGANSLNATTGKPNYVYRYTDPMVTNLSATVRF